MDVTNGIRAALLFCPVCGKELETHPITGNRACFLHGDFVIVRSSNGAITVTFEYTSWTMQDIVNGHNPRTGTTKEYRDWISGEGN